MKLNHVLRLSLLFALGAEPLANAQSVPPLVNYQGRLTDETGRPLPSGTYSVQFRIWPTASETTGLIWGAEYDVGVVDGVFNVILGTDGGRPVPNTAVNNLTFAFTETNRFLGLRIVKDSRGQPVELLREISPRQQLLSAPFAFRANTTRLAESVTPGSINGTSVANNSIEGAHLVAGAVDLRKLAGRPRSTTAVEGGIAVSLPVAQQKLTSATFEDITNLTVTVHTTGRPVLIFLAPSAVNGVSASPSDSSPAGLNFVVGGSGANWGVLRLLRDGGQAAISTFFGSGAGGSQSVGYPAALGPFVDFPTAGRRTYKLQWGFATAEGQHALISNYVLVAFEI